MEALISAVDVPNNRTVVGSQRRGGETLLADETLAGETATMLASVYRLQDDIESTAALSAKRSTRQAEQAYDLMATIYGREFPTVDRQRARRAGRAHVDALFKQDVIENDPANGTVRRVLDDDRWHRGGADWSVEESLATVSDAVAVDDAFARSITEYFRLHGQQRPGWRDRAYHAHKLKATRMTGSEGWGAYLAPYFVRAIEYHDAGAWEIGKALMDRHYELAFELNGASR